MLWKLTVMGWSPAHVIYDLACELIGENLQLTHLNVVVKYSS